ncbi:hypothetical protein [Psychrobacillus soli]|nr:hypothetical protein [Psychrobacillus soli]
MIRKGLNGMLSPGIFIPIWNFEETLFVQVTINIPGQYVTSRRLLEV